MIALFQNISAHQFSLDEITQSSIGSLAQLVPLFAALFFEITLPVQRCFVCTAFLIKMVERHTVGMPDISAMSEGADRDVLLLAVKVEEGVVRDLLDEAATGEQEGRGNLKSWQISRLLRIPARKLYDWFTQLDGGCCWLQRERIESRALVSDCAACFNFESERPGGDCSFLISALTRYLLQRLRDRMPS